MENNKHRKETISVGKKKNEKKSDVIQTIPTDMNPDKDFILPDQIHNISAHVVSNASVIHESKQPIKKLLPCSICDMRFSLDTDLSQHVTTFHFTDQNNDSTEDRDALKLKCKVCLRSSKSMVALKRHIRESHRPEKYPCLICGMKFTRPENLKVHREQIHQRSSVPEFSCKECGNKFRHKNSLKTHIKFKHRVQQEMHHCNYCNKIIFIREDVFRRHIKYHELGEPKKFHCVNCNKKFRTATHLKRHNGSISHKMNIKTIVEQARLLNPTCTSTGRTGAVKLEATDTVEDQAQLLLNDTKTDLDNTIPMKSSSLWWMNPIVDLSQVRITLPVQPSSVKNKNIAKSCKMESDKFLEKFQSSRRSERLVIKDSLITCGMTTVDSKNIVTENIVKSETDYDTAVSKDIVKSETNYDSVGFDTKTELKTTKVNRASNKKVTKKPGICNKPKKDTLPELTTELQASPKITACITPKVEKISLLITNPMKNPNEFYCMHCDQKFPDINQVQSHETHCQQIKQMKKIPICSDCGKIFKTPFQLKVHSVKHSTIQPFSCKFCPNKYKRRRSLINHVNSIHNGELSYWKAHKEKLMEEKHCSQCDKCVKGARALRRHIAEEHDKILYPCTEKDCQLKFKRKQTLKQHIFLFHNDDGVRYGCTLCNIQFRKESNFKQHLRKKRHCQKVKLIEAGKKPTITKYKQQPSIRKDTLISSLIVREIKGKKVKKKLKSLEKE